MEAHTFTLEFLERIDFWLHQDVRFLGSERSDVDDLALEVGTELSARRKPLRTLTLVNARSMLRRYTRSRTFCTPVLVVTEMTRSLSSLVTMPMSFASEL